MIIEAQYNEMREKLQFIRDLYRSGHYSQCAKFSERLLGEAHSGVHLLHLAYLNFYTAVSHDTLAREATINRYKELNLAEKHYSAAIAILAPYEALQREEEHLPSPSSTTSSEDQFGKRRLSNAGSFDSTTSAASSATAYSQDSASPSPPRSQRSKNALPLREDGTTFPQFPQLRKRQNHVPAPILVRPQTPQEHAFVAEILAFAAMLRGHLDSVRALKRTTAAPAVRFVFPEPPAGTRGEALPVIDVTEEKRPAVVDWEQRRSRRFRPRFDPAETQRLCRDVLAGM
ncbi:hypothetical protein IQ07DRAFT_676279 [Pyrenochaeta sp. DS3sAY3a]|nr:hypothetical protein IQ07DRAFT_676279 [Pyrenochaeta sp. DS3sAY3a]